MKLLSLKVENFRCIRKAKIDLGPGLNVLHGPNDLGKSSLAYAIRAALLLQAGSKDYEDFVPWGAAATPQVELVFQTEPQRIWRVRKTFGAGAQAFLDESRDGADFHVEARGRDVDGRLRGLLRWGLTPPGGKGHVKGMPMTFLSTALLAEQDRVAAIFEQSLSRDSDESGKKWLVEALQAIAEDPLFKQVLGKVQARVNEAFTETGKRRTGKGSPWTQIRDLIKQKEEYARACDEQAQKSRVLEAEIQQLLDAQLSRRESLDQAQGMLKEIEESYAQGRERKDIVARLEERKRALGEITKASDEMRQSEERLGILVKRHEELIKMAQAAQAAFKEAERHVQSAKEHVSRLQSDDASRERLLRRGVLEKRQAELETETLHLLAEKERASSVMSQAVIVGELEEASRANVKSLEALEQEHADAVNTLHKVGDQESELISVSHFLKARVATTAIEEAEKNLAQVSAWRKTAAETRGQVEVLKAALLAARVPPSKELELLKHLATDIQVARARVEVGLQAKIRAKRPVRVSVRRDGESQTQHDLSISPLEVNASREISFDIEDLVEVVVSGGVQDARDALAALEKRWTREVQPVLIRANAANLEELAALVAINLQRSNEIAEKERAASQLDQRVADQPDWAGTLAQRRPELAAAEEFLKGIDQKAVERAASQLAVRDPAELENRLVAVRNEHGALAAGQTTLSVELAKAKSKVEETRRSLRAARESLTKASSLIDGEAKVVLRRVVEKQAGVDAERASIQRELAALGQEVDKKTSDAQEALQASEKLAVRADQEKIQSDEELWKAEKELSALRREVDLRRESVARHDEKGARDAVIEVETELSLVPKPPYEITDEALADARQQVQDEVGEFNEINDDLKAKKGALQHIGGEVAKQRAQAAAEAVTLAHEQEHELENDYNAWGLLRSTLQEAEQEEGVHLGKALGGPVAQRFGELTSGRYSRFALGPNLEAQGIEASGEDHSISALSIGTRDQLSTIFRLSLAEQLQSTVLLDDQLTQSDHERLKWLRGLLKQLAATIQIVVFTCRPDDYLLPEELAQAAASSGDSSIRSIDLLQVIGTTGTPIPIRPQVGCV
jgi:hypothetical protein